MFQCLCKPIVFPQPECVQGDQRQALVDPTVSGTEALHPPPLGVLVTGGRLSRYMWKVRSSFEILESVIHSKFPIEAREVPQGALPSGTVAVNNRSIDERCDGIDLLLLQSLSETGPDVDEAGW